MDNGDNNDVSSCRFSIYFNSDDDGDRFTVEAAVVFGENESSSGAAGFVFSVCMYISAYTRTHYVPLFVCYLLFHAPAVDEDCMKI